MTPTYNFETNNEIGADHMTQGTVITAVDVGGDIESKWRYGALDEFVTSCFGKDWAANVLTMGNNRISSSLATYAVGIGIAGIARGAQAATMAFDFPGDNEIAVTTTFTTTGWSDKADDTPLIVSTQPESAQRRYSFKDISDPKLNDQQVREGNACVDSFNLQSDNVVQTQRCISNGNPFLGNTVPTTFTPSGSITTNWPEMVYQLWKAQQTGDATSLELAISNADGGHRISLPEMEVNGSRPDVGVEEIIQVELGYTTRHIPPIIIHLSAPIVITSVTVTPDTVLIAAGEIVDLEAEVLLTGASQTVIWSTPDAAIATTDDTGLVTDVAVGTAMITTTSMADPTRTDTCAIIATA